MALVLGSSSSWQQHCSPQPDPQHLPWRLRVHQNPPQTARARRAPPSTFTAAGGRKAHLHCRGFGHPSMSKAGVAMQNGTYLPAMPPWDASECTKEGRSAALQP